jgi:hypothetical protein
VSISLAVTLSVGNAGGDTGEDGEDGDADVEFPSSLKNGALKMGRLKMAGVNAGPKAARKAVNT